VQAWFAPLVETSSPLLQNFPAFLAEFEATFEDTDQRRTAITKLYSLHQGMRRVSIYASEFRQLACDVSTISVGVFEAMLKIYYSTSLSLLPCCKPSRKQLVVTTGFLSFERGTSDINATTHFANPFNITIE
jgi:molybdopterin-guanine dinucleotide biosynthesis protein A